MMNRNTLALFLMALLWAGQLWGNTHFKCGKSSDPNTYSVEGFELELSSEGGDFYEGPVGELWHMRLEADGQWLPYDESITATTSEAQGMAYISIKIVKAMAINGPVGYEYILSDPYGNPKLEKYNVGGFVGYLRLGVFSCVSSID